MAKQQLKLTAAQVKDAVLRWLAQERPNRAVSEVQTIQQVGKEFVITVDSASK